MGFIFKMLLVLGVIVLIIGIILLAGPVEIGGIGWVVILLAVLMFAGRLIFFR